MKTLNDLLKEVQDKKTFYDFVHALENDFINNKDEWANNSINDFLEGASSWAEDSDFGSSQDATLAENKWKQFAVFLYCGKIYE